MQHTNRTIGIMLTAAATLAVVAVITIVHAYMHHDLRRLGGGVSLEVAALCITWLALRRRPAPTSKHPESGDEVVTPDGPGFVTRAGEKTVDVWVTRIARNRTYPAAFVVPAVGFQATGTVVVSEDTPIGVWVDEVSNLTRDPRAEALLATVRKTGNGTCESDDSHFFASPEEMGIDGEAVGWKYYPCACGKQYDGRYDHEKN